MTDTGHVTPETLRGRWVYTCTACGHRTPTIGRLFQHVECFRTVKRDKRWVLCRGSIREQRDG